MKILAITPEKTGSAYYRIYPQMRYLKKAGHNVKVINYLHPDADELSKTADIVIYENIFDYRLVKMCQKAGAKVIIETDDLGHNVPKTHYNYEDIKGMGKYKWLFKILLAVWFADGLIVTNKKLKRVYGWITRNCLVFPNYCDIEHWIRPYSPNQGEKIRIGFAGSKSHKGDIIAFRAIANRILYDNPNTNFVYIGLGGTKSKDLYAQFIYGEDILKGLSDNREPLIGVIPDIYPHILATLHLDIGIAFLEKNKFNTYKTHCKAFEYGINRIAGVYSKWFYKDIIKHGHNGFLAETSQEWIKYISKLIKNKNLRREIGENAYRTILRKYDMNDYLGEWASFICSM